MRSALLILLGCVVGCAGVPYVDRAAPRSEVLALASLDDRDPEAALPGWLSLAERSAKEPRIARLAIERVDALVADGLAEEAAGTALTRLRRLALDEDSARALDLARARYARLRGDEAAAAGLERQAGCRLPWRAGDSVGRLPRLDLTRPPFEATRHLVEVPVRGCRVVAQTVDGRPAAIPVVLDLTVAKAGPVTIHVIGDGPHQLWADDQAGPPPDDHARLRRHRRYVVELGAGSHRLVVTGAALYGRLDIELAVLAPESMGLRPGGGGKTGEGARIVEARPPLLRALDDPRPDVHYLEAAEALREGDNGRARVEVARLLELAPQDGAALALSARVAAADPSVPARIARDRARALYQRALSADPRLARARYEAGRLALERERARDALELAEAAPDGKSLKVALLRAEALRARGRDAEVRAALDAVPVPRAQACGLVDAVVADDRLRHRPVSLEHARRLDRCHLGGTAVGDALRQAGSLEEAAVEYRRVVATDPLAENARVALGEVLLALGRPLDAIEAFEGLVAIARRSASYRVRLIDALWAAGRLDEARRTLDAGLALDPENAELAAAGRSLGRRADPASDVDLDRIDGRPIMQAFAASGRRYDGPGVFVLDRAVTRVYPNGARRTVTHNLVRVLSKEGIDRWGEWRLPSGAEVLTLCAWKPDGSRLEPEEVPEKESVSLPGLSPGDFVEVEYIERAAAPAAFPGGFLGERFFFASLDAPLDRSEYVLVTPAAMPVEIDSRGLAPAAAPAPTIERRTEPGGEVVVRRFLATEVAQRFAEPAAAPVSEYLPSVRASAGVSQAAWRAFLVDSAWGARRLDPALDELASRLIRGAATDREKLARLDDWVRRNVRHGGGLDEEATSILARREGNRVTLLAALAEAAQLRARILLGRSARAAAIDSELEGYDQPVVEIAGVIVDPRFRHGVPGDLSPPLRGAPALVLEPGPSAVERLPVTSHDAREMRVNIELRPDGGGRVRVEETLRGWPALEWRESLERLPADRVRPQFEQHTLGYYFPGAALEELTWKAADENAAPFVVHYTLDAPALARRLGEALVLPAPFAAGLLRQYATGAARTMPLYVDEVAPTTLELQVRLPDGADVVPTPAITRDEPVGRFAQSAELGAGGLRMRSRFAMPTQRISLEAWPKFLAWVADVDRAEAAVAQIRISRAARPARAGSSATAPGGSR